MHVLQQSKDLNLVIDKNDKIQEGQVQIDDS